MRAIPCFVLGLLLTASFATQAQTLSTNVTAQQIAEQVWANSGGRDWAKVERLHFTFNVSQGTNLLLAATHDWNVWDGTDIVQWAGKTVTINVWGDNSTGDAKAAYKRWVNDSYWLLAPLKLLDKGVNLEARGLEEVDHHTYLVVHVSFGQVGLTHNDQYNLYIDPETDFVRLWDYMPSADKKMTGTWADYKEVGPLHLATDHVMGDKRIWFSNLSADVYKAH